MWGVHGHGDERGPADVFGFVGVNWDGWEGFLQISAVFRKGDRHWRCMVTAEYPILRNWINTVNSL